MSIVGVVMFPDASSMIYEFRTQDEFQAFIDDDLSPSGRYGREGCKFYTLADLKENGGEIGPEDERHAAILEALVPGWPKRHDEL